MHLEKNSWLSSFSVLLFLVKKWKQTTIGNETIRGLFLYGYLKTHIACTYSLVSNNRYPHFAVYHTVFLSHQHCCIRPTNRTSPKAMPVSLLLSSSSVLASPLTMMYSPFGNWISLVASGRDSSVITPA